MGVAVNVSNDKGGRHASVVMIMVQQHEVKSKKKTNRRLLDWNIVFKIEFKKRVIQDVLSLRDREILTKHQNTTFKK